MASDEEGTVATDAAARGTRTSRTPSSKKTRTKKMKSSSGTRSTRSRKAAVHADSDDDAVEETEEKIGDEDEIAPAIVTEVPEAVVEESIVEENGVVFNDADGNCIVEEICTEVQEPDDECSQHEIFSSSGKNATEEAVVLKTDAPEPVKSDGPEPAKGDAPEPAKVEVPKPAKVEVPKVVKTEFLEPAKAEDPEPAKAEAPVPVEADTLEPAKDDAPKHSKSEFPKHGKADATEPEDNLQLSSKKSSTRSTSDVKTEKKSSTRSTSDVKTEKKSSTRSNSDIKTEKKSSTRSTTEIKTENLSSDEESQGALDSKTNTDSKPDITLDRPAHIKSEDDSPSESDSKVTSAEIANKIQSLKKENESTKETSDTTASLPVDKHLEPDSKEEKVKEEKESKFPAEPDTEMVSEDELPNETSKEPLETEAVSDEELPEPTVTTDLPETEAVSEDEFPPEKTERKRKIDINKKSDGSGMGEAGSGKKKKRSSESQKRKLLDGDTYDPSSPTSENSCDETPAAKRAALSSGSSSVPKAATKSRKSLPELEKYWKAVKEDPADFTGWTYLLQYVDQENDIEAAREAYDAFLSHYPYCYGYWRKYADYEKRKGNKRKCEEVFERGLKAIPLSVDLWIHYLNYCKATYPDDETHLRCQFEKAISACGMEFRSDRLWESYIKWESEGKRLQNVTALYDRLLLIPTQGYTNHFDNFQEHISSNPPQKVLSVDEFLTLRREVLQMLKQFDQPLASDDTVPGEETEAPPGEEPEEQPTTKSDEETTALRERIVAIRKKIHKNTVAAVADRWNYEEGIKRPYFHVKPLERCQLKNWKEYLDFEIEQGDKTRIIVLFERCLIACALYEEFWIKFIRYLESLKEDMTDKIRNVYERACTIHHTKKPNLHLHWAVFEESQKNYDQAAEILTNLEKLVPNMLQVAYRRINLERRRNDLNKVAELYEHYINTSKSKVIANNMAIKYARFSWKILGDTDRAISILNKAVEKDKENPRLYLQLIDMGLQKNPLNEEEIIAIIDQFLSGDADPEQKVLFAQRKVEFLEDFGKDVVGVQKAHDEFQRYFKMAKDRKKKSADAEGKSDSAKKAKIQTGDAMVASQQASQAVSGAVATTAGTTVAATTTGQYAQSSYAQSGGYSQTTATGAAASSSYQGGQYPAQQPPTPYSQPPYNQQYSQSGDPNYANYQNWGYSQTGYGGYNQGWGNYNYY
ncbi:pre-mRNA-processing factor 39-like [Schistocerca cancellata]|uniref:pre-mRNA-processing factor 39-like n=1 Tax=Schistocerca cancellata TaxID=274614 RepID=UPI002118CE9B|nr:pre-mRNA-processing factor 39-like [Schistocerca cancellata]